MQINLRKTRLLLRILGTISLTLFLIFQVIPKSNVSIKNYFLFFSAFCFFIILIFSLIRYLSEYYYKK
jgi:hypothetical protein